MELFKCVIKKLLSARFIMAIMFSIGTVIGFMYRMVSSEQFMAVTMLVVAFYFAKERKEVGK